MIRKTPYNKPFKASERSSQFSSHMKDKASLNSKDFLPKRSQACGFASTQPVLVPYGSKAGDEEVASIVVDDEPEVPPLLHVRANCHMPSHQDSNEANVVEDDEESEERKETEQLPFTKDLQDFQASREPSKQRTCLQKGHHARESLSKSPEPHFLNDDADEDDYMQEFKPAETQHVAFDDCCDEDDEIERECNEQEKTQAHNLLRRSVVRKKLNWSQQFNQAQKRNAKERMEAIHKQFQETHKFAGGIKQSLSNTGFPSQSHSQTRHFYHMSQNFAVPSSNQPLVFDLTLAGKGLKFISANLLQLSLKIIDLSNNQLQAIPEEICGLVSLEKLNLDQNQIKALPKGLWMLGQLTTLSARNNVIEELPQGFKSLAKLEKLLINDNKIRELPARLGSLSNLKKLFIHHNLFQELPIELSRLQKLKEFSLEWFLYLNPPMPKIMRDSKGQLLIDQLKSFCRQYTPGHLTIAEAIESEYRSFGDFLLHYHQIRPQEINNLSFGMKKRGILHQLCINGHHHLIQNLICPPMNSSKPSTSSHIISEFIDLNQKDKEGTTPIFFALRQNNQDLINVMTANTKNQSLNKVVMQKLDLDLVNPKYGCPLHLTILKHRFSLAQQLISTNKASPHITNSNGSNAMHILFANFSFQAEEAEELGLCLLQHKVYANLIDSNGLSPIHVAIKKFQQKALSFATKHNQSVAMRRELSMRIRESGVGGIQNFDQTFDFGARGKKGYTPLHYAIIKCNYEAYIYMLSQKLVNIFARDDLFRTPRALALINSPLYKILYKLERLAALERGRPAEAIRAARLEGVREKWKRQSMGRNQNVKSVDWRNQTGGSKRGDVLQGRHQNLNRRCIVKHEILSSFNSVGPKIAPRKSPSLQKSVLHNPASSMKPRSPPKDFALDQRQTKQLIDQIQGGLSSHLHMLAQQQVRNKLLFQNQKPQVQSFNQYLGQEEVINEKNIRSAEDMGQHAFKKKDKSEPLARGGVTSPRFINNYYIQQEIQNFYPNLNIQLPSEQQMQFNINVNLNINISIPPSPKSTRGNQSRTDTIQSAFEEGNHINKAKDPLANRKSFHDDNPRAAYYAKNGPMQEGVNESMRKEDLSVIDDEVCIKSLIKQPQENQASNCREGRTSKMSNVGTPGGLKFGQQTMEFKSFNIPGSPPLVESTMKKKAHREQTLSSAKKDKYSNPTETLENSFKGQIEEKTKRKMKMEELSQNEFLKDFEAITHPNFQRFPNFERYQHLYKLLALSKLPQKEHDVLEVLTALVEFADSSLASDLVYALSQIAPSDVVLNDFLPSLLGKLQSLLKAASPTSPHAIGKGQQLALGRLMQYECANALSSREVLKRQVLESYPKKSHKLQLYLRKQKTSSQVPQKDTRHLHEHCFSNGSDTLEEIFDTTTDRAGAFPQERLREILNSKTTKLKQVFSPPGPGGTAKQEPPKKKQMKVPMTTTNNTHYLVKRPIKVIARGGRNEKV